MAFFAFFKQLGGARFAWLDSIGVQLDSIGVQLDSIGVPPREV